MTSASELFYRRRSRVDRDDLSELGFGSSSSLSSVDRNFHNHQNNSHRRSRRHDRQSFHADHDRQILRGVVDPCDHIRRSLHFRHFCHREPELVRLDQGNQFDGGNNSIRGTSSNRTNRLHITRNDQLPGSVLLARERLVERLRGASLNGNSKASKRAAKRERVYMRQSNRIPSPISWDELTFGDDSSLVDAGDWETETSGEWLAGAATLTHSSTQTDLFTWLPHFTKRPPGLSRKEANCLHREVFTVKGLVTECSICLDSFKAGEILTCLPCGHKFHSSCLEPWVRTCGDCPNCRAGIISDNHRTLS